MKKLLPVVVIFTLAFLSGCGMLLDNIAGKDFDESRLGTTGNGDLSAAVSGSGIVLSWDSVSGAVSYKVYRSTSPSGTYSHTGTVSSASYTDSNVSKGTTYYYKVSAVFSDGSEGQQPGYVSATILNAPAGLSAVVSASGVYLSWNKVSGASYYYVHRSTSPSGTYSRINSSNISGTSYTDNTVSAGTTYYYKVSAVSSDECESPRSGYVFVTANGGTPNTLTVSVPSSYTVYVTTILLSNASTNTDAAYNSVAFGYGSGSGDSTVTLTWKSGANRNSSYNVLIYNGTHEGRYQNGVAFSNGSAFLEWDDMLPIGGGGLNAPAGLSATALESSVELSWSSVTGALYYRVYRSASEDGTYSQISSSNISGTSYTDSTVSRGTTYYYKVSAVASDGSESSLSGYDSATILSAPGGLAATASENSVDLSWDSVIGASYYRVYRSTSPSGTYSQISSSNISETSYTDSTVSAGTTYYYKVSAVASDGSESPQSDNAFATFTGEIQVPAVSLQAALDWLDSNAEDGGAYAITLKSNESIAPRTLSYGSKIVSVTLKGDTTERRISLSTNGSLFTVASGITLTLDSNVTLQGWSGNTASLIQVNSGGTLVMNTGSKISGNSASYGGGAYVSSNGTFTMNSGEISGNTASDGGGGVYADGMFTMSGGEISGNSGGGVYVSSNGTFTMESGEISDNTAGSGVQIVNSTFTMNNGEISGNSAIFGGGVYVSSGTFTMDGGEISGNSASSNGGGVYIITGTFTMKGGEISGNSASSDGGGVYGWSISTFIKQPNAVIYGSNANNPWKNTAGDGRGHAVYFVSNKQRNTTAGMGVTLNSSKSGAAGGWE